MCLHKNVNLNRLFCAAYGWLRNDERQAAVGMD